MACHTRQGPAVFINLYKETSPDGFKIAQADWHALKEHAANGSRARVERVRSIRTIRNFLASRDNEGLMRGDYDDEIIDFVDANNTEGTISIIEFLTHNSMPEEIQDRPRRGSKKPAKKAESPKKDDISHEEIRELAVETDTEAFKIYMELIASRRKTQALADSLHAANGEPRPRKKNGTLAPYTRPIEETLAELLPKRDTLSDIQKSMLEKYEEKAAENAKMEAELERLDAIHEKHGWSRAFLVANDNGHVHKTMSCSTCKYDTQFTWLVEHSGKNEEEIVAAEASRACTVCYPDAPA